MRSRTSRGRAFQSDPSTSNRQRNASRDDTLRWGFTKAAGAGDSRNARPMMPPGTGARTAAAGRPCFGVGTSIYGAPA
jgi:hypothetical protein